MTRNETAAALVAGAAVVLGGGYYLTQDDRVGEAACNLGAGAMVLVLDAADKKLSSAQAIAAATTAGAVVTPFCEKMIDDLIERPTEDVSFAIGDSPNSTVISGLPERFLTCRLRYGYEVGTLAYQFCVNSPPSR